MKSSDRIPRVTPLLRLAIVALGSLLAAGFLPAAARAQADPDSIHLRNDCRLAAQVLSTGNPQPKRQWAAYRIWSCGPEAIGGVIPALIRELAHEAEPEDPRLIVYSALIVVRDGRLFDALMDVAADPTARMEARVRALEVLYGVRSEHRGPSDGFWSGIDPETGFPTEACSRGHTHRGPSSARQGEVPMPDDFQERITALTRRIWEDPTEPSVVRGAAFCTG